MSRKKTKAAPPVNENIEPDRTECYLRRQIGEYERAEESTYRNRIQCFKEHLRTLLNEYEYIDVMILKLCDTESALCASEFLVTAENLNSELAIVCNEW